MFSIYLCGPMSGQPEHNFPAFREAAAHLRARGFHVFNPADLPTPINWTWEDYMKRDLPIMWSCDCLVHLPGADKSKGAKLEMHVAAQLDIPSLPFSNFKMWDDAVVSRHIREHWDNHWKQQERKRGNQESRPPSGG